MMGDYGIAFFSPDNTYPTVTDSASNEVIDVGARFKS